MIDQHLKQYGPLAAWLAVIALALFIGVQASRGFSAGLELETRVETVAEQLRPGDESDPSARRNPAAHEPAEQAAARVQKRYLFMSAPPQGFRNVRGVLGDRVLYPGGQSFGLGENAMGATVTAIGTNWVELEHDGQTITLDIFRGGERGPERLRWDSSAAASATDEAESADQPRREKRQRDKKQRG